MSRIRGKASSPAVSGTRSFVLALVSNWGRKGSTGKVDPGWQVEVARSSKISWHLSLTGDNQYALAA